jgi:hypothetical protein
MTDKNKIEYNLRGIVTGKPSPTIKKIVDSLTPEIMDEVKKELEQEPVSEELEEAVNAYIGYAPDIDECSSVYGKRQAFKAGAKWKEKEMQSTIELAEDHAMLAGMEKMKEQMMENIWKPADGDDLPEIDREVVAFQEIFPTDVDVPSLLKIVIAHRPNTEGYDGKSITTGQVEHYTPKTYDKGGWNIPDVKYWLDVELPKEIEL